ncbi:MAG: endolytic transglycosylase MltG [Parasutterella excrementihominis]
MRSVPFEDNPPEVVIKVDKGSTIRSIANSLKQAGADVDPSILTRAFSFYDQDKSVHVGYYRIPNPSTIREIIDKFASGDVIMSKFTLVEGTETAKFLTRIKNSEDLDHADPELDLKTVMSVVHAPEGTHPEGQFATDTFVFAKGSPDTLVLRRAYREQQERIKKAWETRSLNVAVKSSYELLILASIIEKETGQNSDRALVSSVFNNRLKRGMLLQTDPTVTYGIENFNGKITKEHLRTDHPHNTYTRPVFSDPDLQPGLVAIEAAAPRRIRIIYTLCHGQERPDQISKTPKSIMRPFRSISGARTLNDKAWEIYYG